MEMQDKIKGYIFDYGATLDTHGNHWGQVIWHAYQYHDVPVAEEQYREAYVETERKLARERIIMPHHSFRDTLSVKLRLQLEYLVAKSWLKANVAPLHADLLAYIYDMVCETVKESREVLEELRRRGYPMVLVSNFYGNVNAVLSEFRLSDLFVAVVESAVVGVRKPDPLIFSLGLKQLGLQPEEVMVVGDSIDKDIISSKSLGCMTAWYKGEPWDKTREERIRPDITICSLSELLDI